MKYWGIYSQLKLFIKSASSSWYNFMDKTDAWIMSQDYEILSTKIMIILLSILIIVSILWRLIYKMEDSSKEREEH